MREFIISTESNCDLSPEYVKENNICVIPHYYTVEEDVYGDGNELTTKEFYDEMRSGKKVGTMASNPAVIEDRYTAYAKEGKDVLHISFSSQLSGGCGNIIMTSREVMENYPDMKIEVVDTLSASFCEGIAIMKAVELKNAGKTLEETKAAIEELVPHLNIIITVEDLAYLQRGGRLSKSSALVGTMINLKPILHVTEEGKLVALSKVRGRNKSISTMLDLMDERLGSYKDKQIVVGILHGDCEEEALRMKQMIEDRFGFNKFSVISIGPSIGAHTGPGTLGLCFLGDRR